MKAGDKNLEGNKVYCKKELSGIHIGKVFTIGNTYVIVNGGNDIIWIKDNVGVDFAFSLNEVRSRNFYDYFYSEQEIRKMKLERIENESRR